MPTSASQPSDSDRDPPAPKHQERASNRALPRRVHPFRVGRHPVPVSSGKYARSRDLTLGAAAIALTGVLAVAPIVTGAVVTV